MKMLFMHFWIYAFKAPIKVFFDQGMKFYGEFQELCEKILIDHHITS
jgi:hypothetical protein